ncbi:MAG TPA: SIMPL domain-containing protein [Candidatus Limnocylindrales bacterium]|nr:SIMPL domain-containing protein [Candidatus Limnocylindrales bacterium]
MGPSGRHLQTTALSVGVSVVLVAIALGLPSLGGPARPGSAVAAPTDPSGGGGGITVRGVGKVTVTPDQAQVRLGVQAQASSAATAQSQANAVMARLVAAVKRLGVAEKDLATQWLSLQPQYAYQPDGSQPARISGYQANRSLVVTVRDLTKAGAIIDAGVGAGANSIGGISFSLADPDVASGQARTAAMADARTRAQALASAAGVSLGVVTSINETSASEPQPIAYDSGALAAPVSKAPTQVQPGTTEVEVDLTVTYAIGS